ncbi:MAG: hypothetical protein DRH57_00485 [Candidatus Cloacimonadota bacterium]|nr:MAG: hypothetical protein DRH57_00485 [Candidatus Cloacimonadota bacterium]
MSEITIKLNGKKICTESGKTILEVAKKNNIEIPTLCNDKYLKPYGSCWVCLVQVKGAKGFVTSCGTTVQEGMEIETDNDDIHCARKMALELLLSDHYADCVAPCNLACPAGINVQSYIALISNGEYRKAISLIKEKLPFPLTIGRVCPAPCEEQCRRNIVDEPIAIRQLKRFVADKDIQSEFHYKPEIKEWTGKKVAIVGSGPSGLSAAYFLAKQGHKCVVYEALQKSGGMLRYGIPEYRLPKDILDKEISLIEELGVEIKNDEKLGRDFTLQYLSKEYDAIYLAMGAHKAISLRIPGEDLDGYYLGIDFLREIAMGRDIKIGKKVGVIGGGNTAIDSARTALRLGAEQVYIIYRRAEEQMPAEKLEIEYSKKEGIHLELLRNPTKILGTNGKVSGIELIKMKLGEPDESGRRRPIPIENSEYTIEIDMIISAVSQSPDTKFLTKENYSIQDRYLDLTKWNTIVIDEKTQRTNIDKVFAGGDVTRGPSTVVESIADARKAAFYIDKYLKGEEIIPIDEKFNSKKAEDIKDVDVKEYERFEKVPRAKMPELSVEERITNFNEIEQGFTDEQAIEECKRCMECGCQVNETCDLRKYATNYNIVLKDLIGESNHYIIDDNHPFILRDPNKCINCGRCVRTCMDIQGVGVLGFMYRGFSTIVGPEFGSPLQETDCESCGKCITVCPVGALTEKTIYHKLAPYEREKIQTTCGICGTGCQLYMEPADKKILRTTAAEGIVSDNNICFFAHFGYEALQENDRLVNPMIRREGTLKTVSWQEAEKYIKENIEKLSDNSAIFTSGRMTSEELSIVNKIAERFSPERKYSFSIPHSFLNEKLHFNYSPNPISDLELTDIILVVGQLSHTLGIKILSAKRQGKKLIVISPEDNKFKKLADVFIKTDDYGGLLNYVAKYLIINRKHNVSAITRNVNNFTEYNHQVQKGVANYNEDTKYEECAKLFAECKKSIIIYSESRISRDVQQSIFNLASLKGDIGIEGEGIISTSEIANLRALQSLNFRPIIQLPNINSAFIINEDPLIDNKMNVYNWLNNLEFLIVMDSYLTETARMANVVLPSATFAESKGSFISDDGTVQEVKQILRPISGKSNIEVLNMFLNENINENSLLVNWENDTPYSYNKQKRLHIEKKVDLQFMLKHSVSQFRNYDIIRKRIIKLEQKLKV